MQNRRSIVRILALSALAGPLSSLASRPVLAARPPIFTGRVKGVAVGGYDTVAYFTEKKPLKGDPAITAERDGVTWSFVSEVNRALFLAEPTRYAPQYGGYCAWAVANNYTADGDPEAWTVAGDKLYLNYNQSVRRGWEKDIPGNVRKGDANWPAVLAK